MDEVGKGKCYLVDEGAVCQENLKWPTRTSL